jgi:RimJ/RimL family protein N-acetyltransferase
VATIQLIPLASEHATAMARWMTEPRVAQGIGLRSEPSLERTRAWIERAQDDETCHPFAIVASGTHVGNVVLDQLDAALGTARLSIYVGEPAETGRGVARTAIGLVAEHAATALGLHKLWLTVHVGNAPAIAAYARAGFVTEGVLRDEFLLDGVRTDVLRMALMLG